MVSLWPFGRREDNSPDSFERILSKLAAQIQSNASHLAVLRQRSRRYKALWTLYTVFAYILYDVLVLLLHGHRNLNLKEVGGIVGGPIAIYGVRQLMGFYYDRRIANTEATLEDLQMQQRDTVEKLKAATKYATTQSIIEKYGGGSSGSNAGAPVPQKDGKPKPGQSPAGNAVRQRAPPPQQPQQPQPRSLTPQQIQQQAAQQKLLEQQRAGIPPQFGQTPSPQPQQLAQAPLPAPGMPPMTLAQSQSQTQPSSQQHLQPEEATAPRWYDRLMDLIIGEDETSAKARYALICKNCRMVNGLAPPGTRSLDEMEPWGCARCGVMNGSPRKREEEVVIKREPRDTESDSSIAPRAPKSSGGRVTRSKARQQAAASAKDDEDEEEEGTVADEEEGESSGSESEEDEPEPPKPKSKAKSKSRRKG